ncbi:hypothetical protein KR009_008396, partial [Drosophila setifemur]
MTHPLPILLAMFLHLGLNTTIFINLDREIFANTPIFGSHIFYLSLMDLLCHSEVLPKRWNSVPKWGVLILETISVTLLGEFVMSVVWLTMELLLKALIIEITHAMDLDVAEHSQKVVLEVVTVILAVIFTVVVAVSTNRPAKIHEMGRKVWETTKEYGQIIFARKFQ